MPVGLLITDLDNTLYNWVDYFAPSFRAMVHALARQTGLDEGILIDAFAKVYADKGSLEYSFSVEELECFQGNDDVALANLVRVARAAFVRTRNAHLGLYPGVKETLKWAWSSGVCVIGVTNAPLFHAQRRLRRLRIDTYFSGIAGWVGHPVPTRHSWNDAVSERARRGEYRSTIPHTWSFESAELKPNPAAYARILSDLGASPAQAYVVGDSIERDIAPAVEIGARGVWARYGTVVKTKNAETLSQITPWPKGGEMRPEPIVSPNHVIDEFGALMDIVPSIQHFLPGLR